MVHDPRLFRLPDGEREMEGKDACPLGHAAKFLHERFEHVWHEEHHEHRGRGEVELQDVVAPEIDLFF